MLCWLWTHHDRWLIMIQSDKCEFPLNRCWTLCVWTLVHVYFFRPNNFVFIRCHVVQMARRMVSLLWLYVRDKCLWNLTSAEFSKSNLREKSIFRNGGTAEFTTIIHHKHIETHNGANNAINCSPDYNTGLKWIDKNWKMEENVWTRMVHFGWFTQDDHHRRNSVNST